MPFLEKVTAYINAPLRASWEFANRREKPKDCESALTYEPFNRLMCAISSSAATTPSLPVDGAVVGNRIFTKVHESGHDIRGGNAVASAGMRRGVNLIGDRGAPSRLTTVSHSNFGPSAFVVLSVGAVACSKKEVPNIGAAGQGGSGGDTSGQAGSGDIGGAGSFNASTGGSPGVGGAMSNGGAGAATATGGSSSSGAGGGGAAGSTGGNAGNSGGQGGS